MPLADLKDMTQDMLALAKDAPADLKDMTQDMLSLAKDAPADPVSYTHLTLPTNHRV